MSIVPPPATCREYLGKERGYCPRPARTDVSGRGFCHPHAAVRTAYLSEMGQH